MALRPSRHVVLKLSQRRIRRRAVGEHATEYRRACGVDVEHHGVVCGCGAWPEVHVQHARECGLLRPRPEVPIPKLHVRTCKAASASWALNDGVCASVGVARLLRRPDGVGKIMAVAIIIRAFCMPVAITYTHLAAVHRRPIRSHEATTAGGAPVRGWLGARAARPCRALRPLLRDWDARPVGLARHVTGVRTFGAPVLVLYGGRAGFVCWHGAPRACPMAAARTLWWQTRNRGPPSQKCRSPLKMDGGRHAGDPQKNNAGRHPKLCASASLEL